jgi:hypothetical protein
MKQRSQSVAHGAGPRAADAAAADRRVLDLGAQLSHDAGRRGLLERGGRSIVTPATPGYCSANQRRIDASRAACSASSRPAASRRLRVEDPADHRLLRLVAGERRGERAEERRAVLVHRRLHELPDVGELERAARVVERVADGVEPAEQRLDRLDLEPAVDAPVAQRRRAATRAAPARARRRASR